MLFYAKTCESDVMKHLLDLLATNVTYDTVTWVIDRVGIKISFTTPASTLMIQVELDSENFIDYRYEDEVPLTIGVPLHDLRAIVRNIKSRCSLQISILSDDTGIICFDIGNKGGIVRNIPYVANVQLIDYSIDDTQFSVYHVVSSTDFYNICKHIKKIEDKLTLQSLEDRVVINSTSMLDSSIRHVSYIDSVQRIRDHHPTGKQGLYPAEPLDVSPITTLSRLGKLSTVIQIYISNRYLKFHTKAGSLGHVTVCIKGSYD